MSNKKYTVIELKKICKDKGIKKYSQLKKKELIKKCLGLPLPLELPFKKKQLIENMDTQLFKRIKENHYTN